MLKVKWKASPDDKLWYDGTLHDWGHEATEYGSQSVAIVEAEDGAVEIVPIGRETLKIIRPEAENYHPNNH